jgi:chromosome segregation ATPase
MRSEDEPEPQHSIHLYTQEIEDLMLQIHAIHSEKDVERQRLTQEIDAISRDLQVAKEQLAASQLERENLVHELNRKQTKIYLLEDLQITTKHEKNSIEELEHKLRTLNVAHVELQDSHRSLKEERDRLQATIANILTSHSWRLTAPVRKVLEALRSNSNRAAGK